MVTITDIAKQLGVSPGTVSKALTGKKDVSEKTREKVCKAARELGYLPNAAARSLKTHRSHNLGVLFVDEMQSGLKHQYFAAVLNSFKVEAERLGYDITFISNSIGPNPMSYKDHCRYRNCDGVVIACVNFDDPKVEELIKSRIPTVSIDYVYEGQMSVLSDNYQGMTDLVEYVISMGHEKIAFIHGELTSVTKKRLAAFYDVCAKHGIKIPEEYVKAARYHDAESSIKATEEILALKDRPTCIMYPDDFSYIGGMTVLEGHGLRIPEDISVTGYDGILLSKLLNPKLTTLYQDTERLGKEAAMKLVSLIENPEETYPVQVSVSGELIQGKSVKKLF